MHIRESCMCVVEVGGEGMHAPYVCVCVCVCLINLTFVHPKVILDMNGVEIVL